MGGENCEVEWYMQWLQEYCFLHVGTLCDASKQIFFLSIVCSDCKMDGCDGSKRILFWSDQCNNCMCSVVYLMEYSVIHQNKFSFQCCWLYAFQPNEKNLAMLFNLLKNLWLYFSTYWKDSGYGFQLVENILAMVFNLLKNLWLCFSTCWKKSGYAFQLLKSYILWISGIWKV